MQVVKTLLKLIRYIFTLPILLYQYLISPFIPASCIYTPSCSHYSKEAILTHGIIKGGLLAITRIFRCVGGFFTGGEDPVPSKFSFEYIGNSYHRFRRKRRHTKN